MIIYITECYAFHCPYFLQILQIFVCSLSAMVWQRPPLNKEYKARMALFTAVCGKSRKKGVRITSEKYDSTILNSSN